MKKLIFILSISVSLCTKAQQTVIPLYNGAAPGSESWNWEEKETTKNPLNSRIIYNVTHPTLTAFLPDPTIANGTAIIVCPGGAYQFLLIDMEGTEIARWLNQKGIAAFVLKYRLVHLTTDDPWEEITRNMNNLGFFKDVAAPVVNLELEDGKTAIAYIRSHAKEYNISPDHIGIIGFSAGGTLSANLAYNFTKETRPDFAAMLYPATFTITKKQVQQSAPPVFIAAATDDQLVPVSNSVELYGHWQSAGRSAELHIYASGGHGLATAPSNTWRDRFMDWLYEVGVLSLKSK
jgi:acetyl esterase/lipase